MGFSRVTCEQHAANSQHFVQAERFNVPSWNYLLLVLSEVWLVTVISNLLRGFFVCFCFIVCYSSVIPRLLSLMAVWTWLYNQFSLIFWHCTSSGSVKFTGCLIFSLGEKFRCEFVLLLKILKIHRRKTQGGILTLCRKYLCFTIKPPDNPIPFQGVTQPFCLPE